MKASESHIGLARLGARLTSPAWLPAGRPSLGWVSMPAQRTALQWGLLGLGGFCVLPWFASRDAVWFLASPPDLYGSATAGSGLGQMLNFGEFALAPFAVLLLGCVLAAWVSQRRSLARVLITAGIGGLAWFAVVGVMASEGERAWGLGAAITAVAFAACLAQGLALRRAFGGNAFVAGTVVAAAALIGLFTLLPAAVMLVRALEDPSGGVSIVAFGERWVTPGLWGFGCLARDVPCGVVWNTLALGLVSAALCTSIGFALALLVARVSTRTRRLVRTLALLPIITPPFVIGMAIILLFGRSGWVNALLEWAFGLPPTRWIYGLQGVLLAQVFAFTPVAFVVLLGVVQGVSPVLEEAAQTLRADARRTFFDISLPLMKPGLVGAFLISFVESITDFGNPILLGSNASVLATEVFFSLIGADLNPARAAALSVLLLVFTWVMFWWYRRVLHGADYTTVTAKADRGTRPPLPRGVWRTCLGVSAVWCVLAALVFGLVLIGGFIANWGYDFSPSLNHYAIAFGMQVSAAAGIVLTGTAWDSLFETLGVAVVVAPLTSLFGLLIAWILTRHDFRGRRLFEFTTLVALAIPGTATGVAYVLCFNAPPLELTGTAAIIALCLLFRSLPVAVRAGSAAMSQIDRALDDASVTLGARSLYTFRKIDLPLLSSTLIGTSVYGFVRAVTTVSAVIFLVSADHELATTFILNRVINGDYGVAVAYSTVLIAISLVAMALIRWLFEAGHARPAGGPPQVAAG